MSSYDHREPTNEELWPQPPGSPGAPSQPQPSQAMVPHQPATPSTRPPSASPVDRSRLTLALASMGMGIPISAIAADSAGPVGLVIAWLAIVAVNFIYSWRRP
ncbi:MAG: hypothetical protein QM804_18480 [Propionicimonas sp.]